MEEQHSLIVQILSSDAFINLAIVLVLTAGSAALAWFKRQEVYLAWQDQEAKALLDKAWAMLEAACHNQYALVEQMKAQNPDKKLTLQNKEELKQKVIEDLQKIGQETGVDAVKVFGSRLIGPAITHAVRRLKGKTDNTPLPKAVQNLFPN